MDVINELTLSLYVYIIMGILIFGPLIILSSRDQRQKQYKRKAELENLMKLRNWRTR